MEVWAKRIEVYKTREGKCPFKDWIESLKRYQQGPGVLDRLEKKWVNEAFLITTF